jgi:hypothetical protein
MSTHTDPAPKKFIMFEDFVQIVTSISDLRNIPQFTPTVSNVVAATLSTAVDVISGACVGAIDARAGATMFGWGGILYSTCRKPTPAQYMGYYIGMLEGEGLAGLTCALLQNVLPSSLVISGVDTIVSCAR